MNVCLYFSMNNLYSARHRRSPRGERQIVKVDDGILTVLGIVAPHVGSDQVPENASPADINISIHAPHVGSDDKIGIGRRLLRLFQSTLPTWGATAMYLS